ncbi:MAG: potassium channel family protein [Acidimicrobiales bacterium]
MHVVIVGCGRVGSELAGALTQEGHTVSVIDKSAAAFRRLPPEFGGDRIVGYGFDRDSLITAGVERAGALAAVTSGDNSNIVSARVGREYFGVERVVARIYDPRRATIYRRLGVATVATVAWTTDQVMRRLLQGAHPVDWVEASGRLCVLERDLPAAWAGHKLAALDQPGEFRLIGVTRRGEARLAAPDAVGQEGDLLYFALHTDAVGALDARLAEGAHA